MARMFQQGCENLERLFLKDQPPTVRPEFSRARIKIELSEANVWFGFGRNSH
jgi:hypothetical protein